MHGDELAGYILSLRLIDYILNGYNNNTRLTELVNKIDIWINPLANPDGAYYGGNQDVWSAIRYNSNWVDLNRNYNFNWNNDFNISPDSRYFPGYYPESEKEIKIISKFMKRKNIQLAYFFHSSYSGNFSEMIFFPWKRDNIESYDYIKMLDLAKTMQSKLPKDYENSYYKIYSKDFEKRSLARDFIFANFGTLSFNIETCGIKDNIPIVFPNNKKMKKIVKKNANAIFASISKYNKNLTKIKVVDLKNNLCQLSQQRFQKRIFLSKYLLLYRGTMLCLT